MHKYGVRIDANLRRTTSVESRPRRTDVKKKKTGIGETGPKEHLAGGGGA